MIISRGNIQLDNEAIIARCYDFLNTHDLHNFDIDYGQLGKKLSTVVMAMYLGKNNLRHLMPHYWEEMAPLIKELIKQSDDKNIKRSWFNVLPANTALSEHTHSESKKRGATYGTFVYYPSIIEGDTPIELLVNNEWVKIPIQTGDWICFDLECRHRVPLNNTDRHRISFAFDL